MKVKELIAELQKLDGELDIILQKDAEGNGYSPCAGLDDECVYVAETTWSGEVWSTNWSADDACMDPEEWEEFKKENPPVVVLYPVN